MTGRTHCSVQAKDLRWAGFVPGIALMVTMPNNRPTICTADWQNCIAVASRSHFDGGRLRLSAQHACDRRGDAAFAAKAVTLTNMPGGQSQADRLSKPTQRLVPWKLRPNSVAGGPPTELDGTMPDISDSGCSRVLVLDVELSRFFGIWVAQLKPSMIGLQGSADIAAVAAN
jgi:hypothetical protein